MAYNENFLWFNEGTDAADATGDGQMFKSSSFLGANVTGSAAVTLHFASRNGAATDDTDVDNRYIKAKIISCGNLVEGLKDGDTIYYDKHAGHDISWKDTLYRVIRDGDVVLVD